MISTDRPKNTAIVPCSSMIASDCLIVIFVAGIMIPTLGRGVGMGIRSGWFYPPGNGYLDGHRSQRHTLHGLKVVLMTAMTASTMNNHPSSSN